MFHFWFNTFFVDVDQTVTVKSPADVRGRMPRSAPLTSSSAKLHSTAPPVKPVQTSASSSRLPQPQGAGSLENAHSRSIDKVVKSAVVRTSSGTSSASSGTRDAVSLRRPSQQRDAASARPRSVHLSGSLPVSETASVGSQGSTASSKLSQTGRAPRDKLQTSSASANSTPRSKPFHSQEPKRPPTAAAQATGSKTVSQDDRKIPSGQSPVVSARRGIPTNGKVVGQHQFVSRSDSAKMSRAKAETSRTTPEQNGTLRAKENIVTDKTVDQQAARSAVAGGTKTASSTLKTSLSTMKAASSTPDLNRTTEEDAATRRSVRQPNSSSKASSGVPRFIQRDLASRQVPASNKTGVSLRTAASKQSAAQVVNKRGSIVNPFVQARSEGIPYDSVSLTRFSQRNAREHTSVNPVPGRQMSAPADLQSKSGAVFEVSGSSSLPTTFCTLTLTKSEIDKANKDVQHKVYSHDFKVSIPVFFSIFCSVVATTTTTPDAIVWWLACSTSNHKVVVSSPAGHGLSCSNHGPVALCTLVLGLLNPPSSRGRKMSTGYG